MTNGCVVEILKNPLFTIHCFESPDDGEAVNSLVVETPRKLLIIDVPLLAPYGDKFREYVASRRKPIDRIIVTHAHPDHWFTRSMFSGVDCYALPETLDEIGRSYDLFVSSHKALHGDKLWFPITPPDKRLEPTPIEVDGVMFELHKIVDTEASMLAVLEHSATRTLMAQDLLYHGVHAFVGNRDVGGRLTIESWIATIREFAHRGFDTVLPGHGAPGDTTVFDACAEYLATAKEVIESARDAAEYKQRMTTAFPSHRAPLVAEISGYLLFSANHD